ncbi:hypothetical protein QOZ80_6BG0499470 [Eleusine coracana subsp. coracana]|nr:hypothetical protein QOZ80_6BG0499470 [Eleusine coracana subsp. coracana]
MLFTAELRRAFAAHGKVSDQALGELRYLHLVIRETLRLHAPAAAPARVPGAVPRARLRRAARHHDADERLAAGPRRALLARRPRRVPARAGMPVHTRHTLYLRHWRRMCPGIGFGVANVKVALASFLFHFDWEAPAELDITESFGITVHRKSDLTLRPIQRSMS